MAGAHARSDALNKPEILYHYTTAKGLMGIIETQTLRATNAEFLNDAQELQFGRPQLRDALLEQAAELNPEGSGVADENYSDYSRATVMRSAADHLAPGGPYAQRQYHSVYVACFCEKPDLLSQWRSYAAAGGYAVGFRTAELRLVQPAEPGARTRGFEETAELIQVQYGDAAVKDAARCVLQTVAPDPVGSPGAIGYARAQKVVLPALAGIKHAAFCEEREWRLVVVTDQHEPSFRAGPLGVTPYIALRYPNEAIAEVVIGPGPEQGLREQGVQLLVGADVAVHSSDAPFRG
jgi:hypothetical protein